MAKRFLENSFKMRTKFTVPDSCDLQWYPGHMKKGLDQIQAALRNIDAVLEVHDARIPFSGRHTQLQSIVHIRPHVMLLNKSDMADLSCKQEIINKLQAQGIKNVLFTSCIEKDILNRIKKDVVPLMLKDIESRPKFRIDLFNQYNILVIGIPNVGKSTLINKLRQAYTSNKKCAKVGPQPGVTKAVMNKVRVNFNPDMFVVDTPGILNPKIPSVEIGMKLALCDCIPNRLIGEDLIADYMLYWLNKHQNFSYVDLYDLKGPTDDIMEFLAGVGLKKNFLVPLKTSTSNEALQYRIDFMKTACSVIKDFQDGHFGQVLLDDDCLD